MAGKFALCGKVCRLREAASRKLPVTTRRRPRYTGGMTENERSVFAQLEQAGIVAVLIIEKVEHAVPVAEALLAGGVTAMELTLRTPAAIGALRDIRAKVPAMLAGIGTILTPDQVRQVVDCGAAFGVAPGMNPRVVEAALAAGLPFAPGICTPSDIERALEYDRRLLKFFPAEPSGGLKYLEAIAAPYQHLGVKYVPLGGVSEANCTAWAASRHIGAIGGSWLAPKDLLASAGWSGVTDLARRAAELWKSAKGQA
jgi:2-dehydro-3-deoxyphosphogluconate aldolase/(4S)-4-hydroxy-2-oxoglutarate aldolase